MGRHSDVALLGLLGITSLTILMNRYSGVVLRRVAPALAGFADAAVPSFLVCLALHLATRPARPLALPAAWLAGSALAALAAGRGWRTRTARRRWPHAALAQVAFTLPMGLVFGSLRRWSQSLWPGLGLHVLTNLPGAFGA